MSNILEKDDKNSYEDLIEIPDDNFNEFSRNNNDLFLSVGENDDENNIFRMIIRLIFLKQ